MAYFTCPDCRKKVSSTASFCPHCGYPLKAGMKSPIVETFPSPDKTGSKFGKIFHNGYDLILVDYQKSALVTSNRIKEVINCSYLKASALLTSLPAYLYTSLSYSDAVYIAQSLQYYGMRLALLDPYGNVSYYSPSGYTKAIPDILKIERKPYFRTVPKRQYQFVLRRQKMNTPKGHMSMPKPESELISKEQLKGLDKDKETEKSQKTSLKKIFKS